MNFFKHYTLYNKYVKMNLVTEMFKIIVLLLCIVFYQIAIYIKVVPKLLSVFPNSVVQTILYVAAGIIFLFSWLFIFLKSKEIINSKMTCFLRSLGFNQKDIGLLVIQKTIIPAIVAGFLMTATSLDNISIVSLLRYLYEPLLFALALLIFAIPFSFIALPQQKNKDSKQGIFANKIFFSNKYGASFYKDLLMLKNNFDFIIVIIIELFLLVLYFTYIPYDQKLYYVFLYLIIWVASLTTQSVFQVDVPYSMLVKSLFNNKKELFIVKLFEIVMLCVFPALVFSLLNVGLGNISIVNFTLSVLIIVFISLCLASGSIAILCLYFPNIRNSTVIMILYYLFGIIPYLLIIVSIAILVKFWRSENARSKRTNENIYKSTRN